MKISVYRPQFDDDFNKKVSLSTKKGSKVSIDVVKTGKIIFVDCRAFGRLLGAMTVHLEGDEAKVIAEHVIERDFYPHEAMLHKLVKSLRRRKVKSLTI